MLLVVHGMRRAGNHAVIAWARSAMPPSVFLNDCAPGDPYERFSLMETPQGEMHGRSFRDTRWFAQFASDRARAHVVSYEDQLPEETGDPAGFPAPDRRLIVWRSFPNWLASFQKLMARQRGTRRGLEDPWDIRHVFSHYVGLLTPRADTVSLCYDRWRVDAAYRARMAHEMRLEGSAALPEAVATYGGGSSFGGGDPADRWMEMAQDTAYRDLTREALRDPAISAPIAAADPEAIAIMRRIVKGDTA